MLERRERDRTIVLRSSDMWWSVMWWCGDVVSYVCWGLVCRSNLYFGMSDRWRWDGTWEWVRWWLRWCCCCWYKWEALLIRDDELVEEVMWSVGFLLFIDHCCCCCCHCLLFVFFPTVLLSCYHYLAAVWKYKNTCSCGLDPNIISAVVVSLTSGFYFPTGNDQFRRK